VKDGLPETKHEAEEDLRELLQDPTLLVGARALIGMARDGLDTDPSKASQPPRQTAAQLGALRDAIDGLGPDALRMLCRHELLDRESTAVKDALLAGEPFWARTPLGQVRAAIDGAEMPKHWLKGLAVANRHDFAYLARQLAERAEIAIESAPQSEFVLLLHCLIILGDLPYNARRIALDLTRPS
jgi:hypothetical protein